MSNQKLIPLKDRIDDPEIIELKVKLSAKNKEISSCKNEIKKDLRSFDAETDSLDEELKKLDDKIQQMKIKDSDQDWDTNSLTQKQRKARDEKRDNLLYQQKTLSDMQLSIGNRTKLRLNLISKFREKLLALQLEAATLNSQIDEAKKPKPLKVDLVQKAPVTLPPTLLNERIPAPGPNASLLFGISTMIPTIDNKSLSLPYKYLIIQIAIVCVVCSCLLSCRRNFLKTGCNMLLKLGSSACCFFRKTNTPNESAKTKTRSRKPTSRYPTRKSGNLMVI